MWYEIIVVYQGRHLFATDRRSITSESDLKIVLPLIKAKFPESEGFLIMLSREQLTGTILNIDNY